MRYHAATMQVGVRELKLRLGHYLARVRQGEEIVVTSHGKPVARLEPARPSEVPAALRHLVETGRLVYKPITRRLPPPLPALSGPKTFSQYVAEERR